MAWKASRACRACSRLYLGISPANQSQSIALIAAKTAGRDLLWRSIRRGDRRALVELEQGGADHRVISRQLL